MAPAAAVAHPSLMRQKQSQKTLVKRSGVQGRLSLDGWVCQPSARLLPVATSSQFSLTASPSTTTQKNAFRPSKTVTTLDVSGAFRDESEGHEACTMRSESGCETPKSEKHRIPVVDVDLCPPAPKKPRASGRFSVVCSSVEREGSNLLQKLGFSPSYLF